MESNAAWALKLFNKSPLKQKKFYMINKMLDGVNVSRALDIGSDNGVISFLLREKGGEWSSVDLIAETVESIRGLVGERVAQIVDGKLPFPDNYFDCVVVVDMLEHVSDDSGFVDEVFRVLKGDGKAVFNVPNPKEGLLRKIQYHLGQTDAAHGHLRAGYTPQKLESVLHGRFVVEKQEAYSRFFSVFIDTCMTFALDKLKKKGRGQKGTVVTQQDLKKLEKSFRLYSLIYPVVALFVKLDDLIPWTHGNMLISLCKKA